MKCPHPLMKYLQFFKEIRTYCGWKPSENNILNRIKISVSLKEKVYLGLFGAVVSKVAMLKLSALAIGGVL